MGWFLRLSCLLIILFGFYVMWQYVTVWGVWRVPPAAPPAPHAEKSVPAAYRSSVPALPVDHVAQRLAL